MTDPSQSEDLHSTVYHQLKQLARRELRAGRGETTINTTELVHEAYLKLTADQDSSWQGNAHFFGAASRAMRQVLVDFARRRSALKRGGGWRVVSLSEAESALGIEADDLLALDQALNKLDGVDKRLREVVELRFFAGLTARDVAKLFGVSERTIEREWLKARLFLLEAIKGAG